MDSLGRTLLWQLPSGPAPREFAWSNFDFAPVALSPNGKLLAAAEDLSGGLTLWDTASGQPLRALDSGPGSLDLVVFRPDGQLVLAAGRDKVRLWRIGYGKAWRELPAHTGGTYAAAFTPDGRTLATAGRDREIRLWELSTGTRRRTLAGHVGAVLSLAISPDGRTLASAGEDGKVLLHNLTAGETGRLDGKDRLWKKLAAFDASESETAARMLRSSPRDAAALFAARLQPVPKLDSEQVQRLIAGLDAARFAARSQASSTLENFGLAAAPALRRTLQDGPSLEVRRRIERLLEALEEAPLSPDELRRDRAIELLEHLPGPEARQLLERLAGGAPGARQTEAARAALRRLH